MKVIDAFSFFNEFDILKLRLEYLRDVVDYFVISECNYTHSGNPKPYYLDDVLGQFDSELKSKIISVHYEPDITTYDFSNKTECNFDSGFWKLERGQRNHTLTALSHFDENDLFMLSDADEIPRAEVIQYLKQQKLENDFIATAKCDLFYYNFKTFHDTLWGGTVFTTVSNVIEKGCDFLRYKAYEFPFIENAGWHFSYIGNTEKIRTKLQSFAHQEFNKDDIISDENILKSIESKKDLFGRNENFKDYNLNNFPEDLKRIIIQIFPEEFYEMTEQDVITKPEYLHNNMPPLLEAVLNPDGTGGTELMGRAWQDYVLPAAPDLADWHWAVIPGDNTLSPDSSNIVWLHPHHMEEGIERLLDKEFQKHFKAYVFVSNWQYERFGERLQLPMEKCYVLKNATQPFPVHKKPEGKLQLMFHPNPIRGLDILLESIKLLPEEDLELHIFHELDPDERKKQFQQGFQTYEYAHINPQEEQFLRYCLKLANEDKRVVRHTRTNNSKIREQLLNTHIFAYPTYFMETSCICMIEALCAGCSVLSSNLAALPETGLGFARHYGFIPDRQKHIERFTRELKRTITEYRENQFDNTRQVEICNKYYSWETRTQDWIQFSKELWRKF
jgi:beta-1,4-mannosyl-glycoprotein beta-1,4-N-acetylglucosaminyltransferase